MSCFGVLVFRCCSVECGASRAWRHPSRTCAAARCPIPPGSRITTSSASYPSTLGHALLAFIPFASTRRLHCIHCDTPSCTCAPFLVTCHPSSDNLAIHPCHYRIIHRFLPFILKPPPRVTPPNRTTFRLSPDLSRCLYTPNYPAHSAALCPFHLPRPPAAAAPTAAVRLLPQACAHSAYFSHYPQAC
jgi:hypothetical protein